MGTTCWPGGSPWRTEGRQPSETCRWLLRAAKLDAQALPQGMGFKSPLGWGYDPQMAIGPWMDLERKC